MIFKNIDEQKLAKITDCIKSRYEGKDNFLVLLRGDLASGKTTLVKEYVSSTSSKDVVTSPTFSLQTIYGDDIYHYDLYNITYEDFISLGLLEELEKKGIHFIEWADKKLQNTLDTFGLEYMVINIKVVDDKREYECIS